MDINKLWRCDLTKIVPKSPSTNIVTYSNFPEYVIDNYNSNSRWSRILKNTPYVLIALVVIWLMDVYCYQYHRFENRQQLALELVLHANYYSLLNRLIEVGAICLTILVLFGRLWIQWFFCKNMPSITMMKGYFYLVVRWCWVLIYIAVLVAYIC